MRLLFCKKFKDSIIVKKVKKTKVESTSNLSTSSSYDEKYQMLLEENKALKDTLGNLKDIELEKLQHEIQKVHDLEE